MIRCKHWLLLLIFALTLFAPFPAPSASATGYGDCQYGTDVYGSCQDSPEAITEAPADSSPSSSPSLPTEEVTNQKTINWLWVVVAGISLIAALLLLLIISRRRRRRQ